MVLLFSVLVGCFQYFIFFREVQGELIEKARAKACQDICHCLIEEGACRELRQLISEVVNEEKAERDATLHQLALRIMKARTAQYFNR